MYYKEIESDPKALATHIKNQRLAAGDRMKRVRTKATRLRAERKASKA